MAALKNLGFRDYLNIFKITAKEFFGNKVINAGAGIAFYTILSLPGILMIVVLVAGQLAGDQEVSNQIVQQFEDLVGGQSAAEIENILENAEQKSNNLFAQIAGFVTLLFGATTVFISLQNALNDIWGVRAKPQKGIIKFFFNRLISLALIVSIGFLLLVSLVLDALILSLNTLLADNFSELSTIIVTVINFIFSFGFITLVFAVIFRWLPDARIQWRDVWKGAILTTILFTIGKYLIGIYLGNSTVTTAYGAAGSLVLLLIWVYYSTVILLFGAQFTLVYTNQRGRFIRPIKNAVLVRIQEIEREDGKVNTVDAT